MFIHLAELDEIILSFREVMDYRAYMSQEYCLMIEIAVEKDEAFERIKNKMARVVWTYIFYKFTEGVKLPVKVCRKNGYGKITNSMVKRKICDLRSSE
jgi:hypothetical protein